MSERSPAAAFASDVASAVASLVAVAFIVDIWTRGGVIARFRRATTADAAPALDTGASVPGVWKMLAEADRITREAASDRGGA